jgi:hypothetical protein
VFHCPQGASPGRQGFPTGGLRPALTTLAGFAPVDGLAAEAGKVSASVICSSIRSKTALTRSTSTGSSVSIHSSIGTSSWSRNRMSLGLGRSSSPNSAHDSEPVAGEVDRLPAEPEGLAPAYPGTKHQDPQCGQAVVLGGFEELARLPRRCRCGGPTPTARRTTAGAPAASSLRVRKPPFLRSRRRPSGEGGRSTTKLHVSPRRKTRPRTVTRVPEGYDKFRDHFVTICDHEGPVVRGTPPLTTLFLGRAGRI